MIISHIEGATRTIGQSQGYLGLPLRDELTVVTYNNGDEARECSSMLTAWEPTPDELERLAKGAKVYLRVIGQRHPPVMLSVGEVPDVG